MSRYALASNSSTLYADQRLPSAPASDESSLARRTEEEERSMSSSFENKSGRIHGFWGLLFSVYAFAGIVGESTEVYFLVMQFFSGIGISIMIWLWGCDRRGANYWPVSFKNRQYIGHICIIVIVGSLLIGPPLRIYLLLVMGVYGAIFFTAYLSVDLILYDTKSRYDAKTQHNIENFSEYNQTFKNIHHNKHPYNVLLVALTILILLITFISQYDSMEKQIMNWWYYIKNYGD